MSLEMSHRYVAFDQHGGRYWIRKCPRKELLEQLNRKHADKMFIDSKGKTYHIGYIIAGLWIEIFKIKPFKED